MLKLPNSKQLRKGLWMTAHLPRKKKNCRVNLVRGAESVTTKPPALAR